MKYINELLNRTSKVLENYNPYYNMTLTMVKGLNLFVPKETIELNKGTMLFIRQPTKGRLAGIRSRNNVCKFAAKPRSMGGDLVCLDYRFYLRLKVTSESLLDDQEFQASLKWNNEV